MLNPGILQVESKSARPATTSANRVSLYSHTGHFGRRTLRGVTQAETNENGRDPARRIQAWVEPLESKTPTGVAPSIRRDLMSRLL